MTEKPAEQLGEEAQEERGAPGSRDEGGAPAAGPADRPVGTSDEESDTSIDPQGTTDPSSPDLPAGGG